MITKYRGVSISDNNKGQWMYGNLIIDGNYAYIVNGVIECNDQYITIAEWCPVDPKTIGASTGLFDKKGKEIFEGDVVESTWFNDYDDCVGYRKAGTVVYKNGYFGIEYPGDVEKGYSPTILDFAISVEIISNIYENPELVEEATND